MVRKKANGYKKQKCTGGKSAQTMSHNLRLLFPFPPSEAQFEIRLAIIPAGERGSRGTMCVLVPFIFRAHARPAMEENLCGNYIYLTGEFPPKNRKQQLY